MGPRGANGDVIIMGNYPDPSFKRAVNFDVLPQRLLIDIVEGFLDIHMVINIVNGVEYIFNPMSGAHS